MVSDIYLFSFDLVHHGFGYSTEQIMTKIIF